MSSRRGEVDRFYGLLCALERRCGGKRRLDECDGGMGWPERGVYFFFEPGELREDGVTPRVVRVGTHALRPSRSTLWGRLAQHRGTKAGDLPGGGDHRASIFRRHVGAALAASGRWPSSVTTCWGKGSTARRPRRRAEHPLEAAVSEYIGAMPFLWLGVSDAPAIGSDRGVIEQGAIALLSSFGRPAVDPPSRRWLGRRAEEPIIAASGLWNVQHAQESDPGQVFAAFGRWLGR